MSVNDITKDKQQTKPASDLYRDNYDQIFKKKTTGKHLYEISAKGYDHEPWEQLDLDLQQYYEDSARMREAYNEECDYIGCKK